LVCGIEGVMTSGEERKARHKHKEAVLRRVLANADLIRQIEESLEARRRGERAVPFKEIRREPDAAFIEVVGLSKLDV
jgi:hypothetical protein